MSIRTSHNSKGQILSSRSPIRTLLESVLADAMDWVSRKKDKTGRKVGKVSRVEDIVKWEKDTFSLYGSCSGKTINVNDIRGKAVFLRRLPEGRIDIADYYVFCISVGRYVLTDWMTVWQVLDKLTHDHGTVIYRDAWRMDKNRFVELLQKVISDKMKQESDRKPTKE